MHTSLAINASISYDLSEKQTNTISKKKLNPYLKGIADKLENDKDFNDFIDKLNEKIPSDFSEITCKELVTHNGILKTTTFQNNGTFYVRVTDGSEDFADIGLPPEIAEEATSANIATAYNPFKNTLVVSYPISSNERNCEDNELYHLQVGQYKDHGNRWGLEKTFNVTEQNIRDCEESKICKSTTELPSNNNDNETKKRMGPNTGDVAVDDDGNIIVNVQFMVCQGETLDGVDLTLQVVVNEDGEIQDTGSAFPYCDQGKEEALCSPKITQQVVTVDQLGAEQDRYAVPKVKYLFSLEKDENNSLQGCRSTVYDDDNHHHHAYIVTCCKESGETAQCDGEKKVYTLAKDVDYFAATSVNDTVLVAYSSNNAVSVHPQHSRCEPEVKSDFPCAEGGDLIPGGQYLFDVENDIVGVYTGLTQSNNTIIAAIDKDNNLYSQEVKFEQEIIDDDDNDKIIKTYVCEIGNLTVTSGVTTDIFSQNTLESLHKDGIEQTTTTQISRGTQTSEPFTFDSYITSNGTALTNSQDSSSDSVPSTEATEVSTTELNKHTETTTKATSIESSRPTSKSTEAAEVSTTGFDKYTKTTTEGTSIESSRTTSKDNSYSSTKAAEVSTTGSSKYTKTTTEGTSIESSRTTPKSTEAAEVSTTGFDKYTKTTTEGTSIESSRTTSKDNSYSSTKAAEVSTTGSSKYTETTTKATSIESSRTTPKSTEAAEVSTTGSSKYTKTTTEGTSIESSRTTPKSTEAAEVSTTGFDKYTKTTTEGTSIESSRTTSKDNSYSSTKAAEVSTTGSSKYTETTTKATSIESSRTTSKDNSYSSTKAAEVSTTGSSKYTETTTEGTSIESSRTTSKSTEAAEVSTTGFDKYTKTTTEGTSIESSRSTSKDNSYSSTKAAEVSTTGSSKYTKTTTEGTSVESSRPTSKDNSYSSTKAAEVSTTGSSKYTETTEETSVESSRPTSKDNSYSSTKAAEVSTTGSSKYTETTEETSVESSRPTSKDNSYSSTKAAEVSTTGSSKYTETTEETSIESSRTTSKDNSYSSTKAAEVSTTGSSKYTETTEETSVESSRPTSKDNSYSSTKAAEVSTTGSSKYTETTEEGISQDHSSDCVRSTGTQTAEPLTSDITFSPTTNKAKPDNDTKAGLSRNTKILIIVIASGIITIIPTVIVCYLYKKRNNTISTENQEGRTNYSRIFKAFNYISEKALNSLNWVRKRRQTDVNKDSYRHSRLFKNPIYQGVGDLKEEEDEAEYNFDHGSYNTQTNLMMTSNVDNDSRIDTDSDSQTTDTSSISTVIETSAKKTSAVIEMQNIKR